MTRSSAPALPHGGAHGEQGQRVVPTEVPVGGDVDQRGTVDVIQAGLDGGLVADQVGRCWVVTADGITALTCGNSRWLTGRNGS